MKTKHQKTRIVTAALGVFLFGALPVEAEVLVAETFDYADGEDLNKLSGGTGWWSGTWSSPTAVDAKIQNGELVAWTDTTDQYPGRSFTAVTGAEHGMLYFSVDFNNLANPYGRYTIEFRSEGSTIVQIGQRGDERETQWGIRLPGVSGIGWILSGIESKDKPNFQRMVLGLDYKKREAFFYMNPDLSAPEPLSDRIPIIEADFEKLASFDQIRIGAVKNSVKNSEDSSDEPRPRHYDNIFIATKWSDFADIPELKASSAQPEK